MKKNALTKEELLNEEQMNGKINMFAKVTILPGETLEHHEHHDETETYYILSGAGIYDDDGTEIPAKPGDVFFCKDGHGHGITSTGEEPLVFMALIIRS
ncbi:MAG: cupin domain-containing protein [Clostridiales bacterium]|nr:cupin domain-containing protein [Clostridiales bacterium]